MDDVVKVRFVPKNHFGKYNCAVEIVRMGDFCKIYLRPEKEGGYVNPDSLQELLDADAGRQRGVSQFWVGRVLIKKSLVPEHEIEMFEDKRHLKFVDAVSFFEKTKSFKRV